MDSKRQPPAEAKRDRPAAPSWLMGLFEAPRALSEAGSLLPARAFLHQLEGGDGHAVMTLPGFLASDRSMRTLRRFLERWGYRPRRWNLGRNLGPRRDGYLENALDARLQAIHAASGRKVSLVGWSLGGLLARELSRRHPQLVRNVIALGSPLGDPKATNAWRLFEILSGHRVSDAEIRRRIAMLRQPVDGVPTTAIYSRSDAVVSWKIARLPSHDAVESIGVAASHMGMGFNPLVLYLIADRLRQPEGEWRPFDKSGLRQLFFR